MPHWRHFIVTKMEVDDDDLPLAKHRIFDDDGQLKPVQIEVSSSQKTPVSAKKSRPPPIKQPAHHTEDRRSQSPHPSTGSPSSRTTNPGEGPNMEEESPSKSPSPVAVGSPSTTEAIRLIMSKRATAVGGTAASPSVTPPVAPTTIPARSTSRKDSAPKKSKSPKRKTSAKRVATPVKSKSKSAEMGKSKTPKSRSQTPSSSTSWTVPLLKEYAKKNSIAVTGLRSRDDLVKAIKKATGKDITKTPPS